MLYPCISQVGREMADLALASDLIHLQNEVRAGVFPSAICSVYPRDWSQINFFQCSLSVCSPILNLHFFSCFCVV